MRRVVARLLVFLMVPAVWLATSPEVANAATGSARLDFTMQRLGPDVSCSLPMTYGGLSKDGVVKIGHGYCSLAFGGDGVPFTCGAIEADCSIYDVQFSGCPGSPLPDNPGDGGSFRTLTMLGPATVNLGICVPTQVCLHVVTQRLGLDYEGSACVDHDFSDGLDTGGGGTTPTTPPADITCAGGHPQGISTTHVYTWGSEMWKDKLDLIMLDRTVNGTARDHWSMDLAHGPSGNLGASQIQSHSTQSEGTWKSNVLWGYDPTGSGLGGSHEANKGETWGIQVFNSQVFTYNMSYFGYTDPKKCLFYFGPKFRTADHPDLAAGSQEPWGEITPQNAPPPEVIPEPEPAPVPVADPGPDTDFGLLQAIVSALGALAEILGDIVGSILDGLKALFVPDKGFMDDSFGSVKDKWQDTTPVQFVNVFDGLSSGTVSGCEGLPLRADLGGGVQIDEHIGAACSGPMAGAATLVRAALTALIFFGGAVACLRGIGAGFGWRPSIGRQGDES